MTPIKQVIIPATNSAPPPMNTGRSLAQANTLPESIVKRQELAAAAVSTGPRTTIIIPRMKMSDLKFSYQGSQLSARKWWGGRFSKRLLLHSCFQGYYRKRFPELWGTVSQAEGNVRFTCDLELEREVWSIAGGLCGSSHFARRKLPVRWPRRFQLWIRPPVLGR